MNSKFAKAYAAYVSGWLGKNICHAWFLFFAELLLDMDGDRIEIVKLRDLFEIKYGIRVPIDFVKKTLELCGSSCVSLDSTKVAVVDKVKLQAFSNPDRDYREYWKRLVEDFQSYRRRIGYADTIDVESMIIDCIEQYDVEVVSMSGSNTITRNVRDEFIWNKYIQHLHNEDSVLYNFVCSLCYGSIAKDAIFRTDETNLEFRRLTVYLDTPLLFHLLGISEKEECEASQYLINSLRESGCDIRVFNHTLEEAEGVARSAKKWALDVYGYNPLLASKTARYFRSHRLQEQQIDELICNIEGDLCSKYGIRTDSVTYDNVNRHYQIDEKKLKDLFEARLSEENADFRADAERRIRADIRSIAMLYHCRGSSRPKNFHQCRVLMVTPSKGMANVSREYQKILNDNRNNIIPVCLSSKNLAAMLWISAPKKLSEYKRFEMIADCARFLKPTDNVLRRFFEKLDKIDPGNRLMREKYFLLTASPVMEQALMDVTEGVEECVVDNTFEEVYERVQRAAIAKHVDLFNTEHAKEVQKRQEVRIAKIAVLNRRFYYAFSVLIWIVILSVSALISFNAHARIDEAKWIGFFIVFMLDGVILAGDVHAKWIRGCAWWLSRATVEFLVRVFSA